MEKQIEDLLKNKFEKNIKECIITTIRNYKEPKPVRVKIDNEYFITPKGKTVWNGIGPAKNALRIHLLDNMLQGLNWWMHPPYRELRQFNEDLFKKFLKERVQFEEL